MKKWIFTILLTSGFSISQPQIQYLVEDDHVQTARAFSPLEADFSHPDAVRTGHLYVKSMQTDGFSGDSLQKLQSAFKVLEQVMNSEEFKTRIINFKNRKGQRAFASNKGMSNEQIFEHLMEGRENLQPNTPGEMNLYLKLYNKSLSRVIGYTTPKSNLININWKYFKNFTLNQVSGNLAHEWVHKMGFDHKSASEHDSVPYAVGNIVEEMGRSALKKELH